MWKNRFWALVENEERQNSFFINILQYLMYKEVVMIMMTMKVAMRSDWLSG